jgi:hypothetical protein
LERAPAAARIFTTVEATAVIITTQISPDSTHEPATLL